MIPHSRAEVATYQPQHPTHPSQEIAMARASKPTKRTRKAPKPSGGTADQQAEMKRQWLEQEQARAAERGKDIAAQAQDDEIRRVPTAARAP